VLITKGVGVLLVVVVVGTVAVVVADAEVAVAVAETTLLGGWTWPKKLLLGNIRERVRGTSVAFWKTTTLAFVDGGVSSCLTWSRMLNERVLEFIQRKKSIVLLGFRLHRERRINCAKSNVITSLIHGRTNM